MAEESKVERAAPIVRDICEGIDGSGNPVWTVFAMRGKRVVAVDRFDNKAEAENWVQWAGDPYAEPDVIDDPREGLR